MITYQSNYFLSEKRSKQYRLLLAIGATGLFGLTFLIGDQPTEGINPVDVVIALFAFPTFFLFLVGLGLTNQFFDKRNQLGRITYQRYVLEIPIVAAMSILFTSLLLALPAQLVLHWLNHSDTDNQRNRMMFRQLYAFTGLVHLLLYLIVSAFYTLQHAFQAIRTAEQLRKENVQQAFETLKNQINPHFLFNSLNALSILIYRNKDEATQFVDELSAVYRYVLDQKDKELVLLEQELTFMQAYLHLLTVRYRESLVIQLPKSFTLRRWNLPPLTLQTLVDHALKQQVATRELPLSIQIVIDESAHKLTVRYHDHPRAIVDEDTQTDLYYLSNRFGYLTDRPMSQNTENGYFIIQLPLLELD